MIRQRLLGFLLAAAILPAPAGALVPEEVLVVANANAEGSVALAKYYCLSRNILEERLVVLRTTASAIVGRKEYDQNIRRPLREHLIRGKLQGKIKCLTLVWGVPVRVLGPEMTSGQRKLVGQYRTISKRLQGRLAVNAKLLGTVGLDFPSPTGDGLRPLGNLFAPKAAAKLGKVPGADTLKASLASQIRSKAAAAARLKNPAQRRIALRQVAALRLDTFGPGDLLKHLPAETISGIPSAEELRARIKRLTAQADKLAADETVETAKEISDVMIALRGSVGAYDHARARMKAIDTADQDASVDSELSLLLETGDAPLRNWRPNPLNWQIARIKTRPANLPASAIMTARIDGPSPKDALRIIKDSIATEKTGIKGKFYIDAGGKYKHYEPHLMNLHKLIDKHTKIPVVLDRSKNLFARDSCPDAAMYVGWYSLQKYVPAFTWSTGAVAWHVASLEAMHLRTPKSNEWCVKMIQNGVAATLGAVNEPYLGAFPLPEQFYAMLLTGHFTVAECYWRTVPAVSWRLTLIADPLYNPFRLHPKLTIHRLPPAMRRKDFMTRP